MGAMFKGIKKIIWLLFCLLGGWLLMNQFDQPLQPGAAKLLHSAPMVAPEQNAYFALLGLDAPPTENVLAWGKKISLNQLPELPKQADKPVCDLDKSHCLKLARQTPHLLQQALQQNSLLQTRYVAARQMPVLQEAFDDDAALNFSAALRAQMLRHAQMALWLEAGAIAPLMQELREDMVFQRRGLIGARGLITKMVFLAALQRDYVLLADLLRAHPAQLAPYSAQVQALLSSLTPTERDLLPVVQREFQWQAKMMRSLGQQGGGAEWLGNWSRHLPVRWLFLPNATVNKLYRLAQGEAQLAQAEPTQFAVIHQQVTQRQAQLLQRSWRDVYNPLGTELVRIAIVDFHAYLRRPWELEAFIRLMQLQQALARQTVPDEQISHWLGQQSVRDPFSGEAIAWDPARRELFIPLDRPGMPYLRFGRERDRLALPLP